MSHLEDALRSYMAKKVGGSINLDAHYLCRHCDSRMDLVRHALKLINTCTYVSSRADIEKILNIGICILSSSQRGS
uniref:Oberon-like PHD finger domain-containing protein n=1 Tax=Solanum lycopersicum TaxID=4081 RepID=A0A3Q7IYV8_SOLLC